MSPERRPFPEIRSNYDNNSVSKAASQVGWTDFDIRQSNLDPYWITTTFGFGHLARNNGYAEVGYDISRRYRNLLDHADSALQPYLRSGQFVSHMFELGHEPYAGGLACQRIIAAAESGDVQTFLFGARYTYPMRLMDESAYKLDELSTSPPQGMSIEEYTNNVVGPSKIFFNERFKEVFSTVADTSDTSKWRQFLLQEFASVFFATMRVGDNMQEYWQHAEKEYARIRMLVEVTDPANFPKLGDYIHETTSRHNGPGAASEFDNDIKLGNFDRYEQYKRFRQRLSYAAHRMYVPSEFRNPPVIDLEAQEFWATQFATGALPYSSLEAMPAIVEKLDRVIGKCADGLERTHPIRQQLHVFRKHEVLMQHPEVILRLIEEGIIPTETLISYLRDNSEHGILSLHELRAATERGEFDPSNKVQRDLEYTKFLSKITPPYYYGFAERFGRLKYVEENGEVDDLSYEEAEEARATAYEAALLYWELHDMKRSGRDITAIGNQRYGALFVTEPLKRHLFKLGIRKSSAYINSSGAHEKFLPKLTEALSSTRNEGADIVFVDGTMHALDGRPEHQGLRFPSSMYGFLNWLLAYNYAAGEESPGFEAHLQNLQKEQTFEALVAELRQQGVKAPFAIKMWTPMADDTTDSIIIGNTRFPYTPPDAHSRLPQAILVNPVISPERAQSYYPDEFAGHKPGFFDDPDSHVRRDEDLGFTNYGLTELKAGKTEEQYVNQVQDYMDRYINEMIRRADPINRN